jgi:hypothetical protein
MKKKMLWKSLCENGTLEMFVNMTEYSEENDCAFEEIKPHVLTRLTNFESNFKNHFPELTLQQHEWMRNPFAVTIGEKISHLSIKTKESLMELSCNISLMELSCNIYLMELSCNISLMELSCNISLMELSCNISLKIKFEALSVAEFWIYMKKNAWNAHN